MIWSGEGSIEWVVLADGAVCAGILRWVCASKVKSMLSGRVCDFKWTENEDWCTKDLALNIDTVCHGLTNMAKDIQLHSGIDKVSSTIVLFNPNTVGAIYLNVYAAQLINELENIFF